MINLNKVKAKIVETKTRLHLFYIQNEEKVWMGVITVAPIAIGGIKAVSKAIQSSNEERHRLLMDYDPSMGWYNQLKRPLNSQDKEMILELRNKEGLNQTEALLKLNLLKK